MGTPAALSKVAPAGQGLTAAEIEDFVARACLRSDYQGAKILLIIPDGTRTAPIGAMFKALHRQLAPVTRALDILVALGTHAPMTDEALCRRLEMSAEERASTYRQVRILNHAWNEPTALKQVGVISAAEISELSEGLFAMEVPVSINKLIFDYDQVLLIGPVFPHEVVGFSGGNKYLFPGIAGPEILNFFHWLGAVVTNPMIIGRAATPVRRVVDRAGALVGVDKRCFCLVVSGEQLAGLFAGTPETAWAAAVPLSEQCHIIYKDRPYHTIVSCAPPMYDDLWTGGKCMYKLEPVLADGGELIIYAPHISELSVTHGRTIEAVGYHCRDYFLKQWDRFKHHPWGVLAHSTHVRGVGTYDQGVEHPRAKVTLATAIPEAKCHQINLGWRAPQSLRLADFAHREDEGILLAPKAGEMLFRLK